MNIREHSHHYIVVDENSNMKQYNKDDLTDLKLLVDFLINEYCKAEDKQSQWFEKYWELKKQINTIKDVIE